MNLAVLGAQWGDEGKGKIVDLLTPHFSIVARLPGRAQCRPHGVRQRVQIHPTSDSVRHSASRRDVRDWQRPVWSIRRALFAEVDELGPERHPRRRPPASERQGAPHPAVSPRLDLLSEARRGERKIGTTSRGIGPAYEDKIARGASGVCDLFDPTGLEQNVRGQRHGQKPPGARNGDGLADRVRGRPTLRRTVAPVGPGRLPLARPGRARGAVDSLRGRAGHASRHRPRDLPVRDVIERKRSEGSVRASA